MDPGPGGVPPDRDRLPRLPQPKSKTKPTKDAQVRAPKAKKPKASKIVPPVNPPSGQHSVSGGKKTKLEKSPSWHKQGKHGTQKLTGAMPKTTVPATLLPQASASVKKFWK